MSTISTWEKKIPGFLGLLLIIGGLAGTTFLVQTGVKLFSGAAPSNQPHDFQVTNVTDESFTVVYRTEASVIGTISLVDETGATHVVLDDRDQATGKPLSYQLHSITARGLRPLTHYTFSITSGENTFLNQNSPFTATTGPTISDQPLTQAAVSGTLILPDGTKPTDSYVLMSSPNGQILSTLVKTTGTYAIPTNTLRSSDLTQYVPLASNSAIQLQFYGPTSTSQVLTNFSNAVVPQITLGNNYDFTTSVEPVASSAASAFAAKFPQFVTNIDTNITVQITSPKENATYTDQQPVFKGTALPNSSVQIEIHSDQAISASVSADALGNWSYRPNQQLTPGDHTITITTKDASGIIRAITNHFTVYAAGTQVNQTATPSATLAPSLTPTDTPVPTAAITTTPAASTSPTIVLSPTRSTSPTLKPTGLPSTGPENTFMVGLIGVGVVITGSLLFMFSVL